ncbi:PDZ domain containing 4 [Scophthalmus maximus]|uniref:PDZ domain containing 4 n=1 Tax=Scophthalmus maximus TaxID=52904 RepID=A0A2U9BE39_SCOMX|nr:PDZ domain containing 4 [Scophthalmus maximus]
MGCWLSGPWMGDQTMSGRSLANLSQRDILRILAASQHPITMQIKGQRGCGTEADRGAWEPLPLNLQHLNLPLPVMGAGLNASSPSYQDRLYYSHLSLPQDHCDGGRYSFLSSSPGDTVDIGHQDPELTGRRPKDGSCLMGCCNTNAEEANRCHSQTDDEDFMLEKPLGFLPLHHELDSGLGWTDGSIHQGDLSGLETEEGGLEDCHSHGALAPGGCGGFGGGGSPSSESFISSELSDSGFYSVSTGEFRHFQRLLEKRMRLYNARLQHQGEACERRERRDSCPKSHRELLEAIPEALTMQPQSQCLQLGLEEAGGSVMEIPPRGLFRVSSVQFHKADRPCLNRHSSSSGALFNPSHAHAAVSRMNAPVLSTCSTPSSHRRPLVPIQPQHHQGSSSVGMLRRSRTLHHRPPPQEYRRRASHPASPSYCTASPHHCGVVSPHDVLPPGPPEEGGLVPGVMSSYPAALALSPQQHSTALGHLRPADTHERCYDNNSNSQIAHHDWWHSQDRTLMPEPMLTERDREIERELEQKRQMQKEKELQREREAQIQEEMDRERQQELERSRAREQLHLQSLVHPSQSLDVNDTWPKPASRQSLGGGGGRGLYSTLEGHTGAAAGWEANKGHFNVTSSPNPSLHPKLLPSPKPNTNTRISRNQLLRDRATQLADERSGMSTDEETNTDILMGRYWSRTERREHFLLAREQRQHLQQLQARGVAIRDAVCRGGAIAGGGGGATVGDGGLMDSRGVGAFAEGRCNTVLELSQKKLSRLRNRKLLDDWTTVEELLTHGTRMDSQEDVMRHSSLLTVTTV